MYSKLVYFLEAARYIPGLLKTGGGKVLAFFTSGWYSYLGMAVFVFADHYDTIARGDFRQTFVDIGLKLGGADSVIAENLSALGNASGLEYISTVMTVLVALFTVLWFLRTVATILDFIWGEMVPNLMLYGFAVLTWLIAVLYVEGRLPLATIELFLGLPEYVNWSQLSSFEIEFLNNSSNSTA